MKKTKSGVIPRPAALIIISALTALVLIFLSETLVFQNLELKTTDFRFAARDRQLPPSDKICIIAIDSDSLEKIQEPLFRWPVFVTEVCEKLSENGAKVVGIDTIQEIPLDDFSPGHTKRTQMLLLRKKIVLISFIEQQVRVRYPIRQLTAAAGLDSFGPANIEGDRDDVIRRQPIHIKDPQDNNLLTFPFVILSRYLEGEVKQETDEKYTIGSNQIKDENGFIRINYAGPANSFRTFSFVKVLEEARKGNNKFFDANFRDRIVLIGYTSPSTKDLFPTPFNVNSPWMTPGIEIHANTINTVLRNSYLSGMDKNLFFIVVFLFCTATSFVCYYSKPLVGSLFVVCLTAGYIWLSFFLFSESGYFTKMLIPSLAAPATYGLTFFYRYITVDRRMRKIRNTFSRLISPAIEEVLWKELIAVTPGVAEERVVTILFSDINDFTPICTRNTPADVMMMLNEYFTEMIDIIYKNRGNVKQFVGDEIMVMYGAPVQEPHQALLAVKTAVEMVRRLRELKEKSGKEGFHRVKIGIHTGKMVLGFLGSESRLDYTAIGESVNLASRIEHLNKIYDCDIMISEDTYNEIQKEGGVEIRGNMPGVRFENLGPQEIRGFDKKINIYKVIPE
ncbi:MAG: adenylate/guanylate cyclase domain-containing protein [Firmicutes bacterium]|nr:adenylate/guanylate cyclase domain-containing protein [Bacillota bacterium]